jgi:hypothetical protein
MKRLRFSLQNRRLGRWLILGAAFASLLLWGGLYWPSQARAPTATAATNAPVPHIPPGLSRLLRSALAQRPRRAYPYSVIPGGVSSPEGLRYYNSHDHVAAAHYADFNLAKARVVQLKAERWGYVSYRVGDEVFWTRRKLRLAKGEQLITDGVHYARTRCGNRISAIPRKPTWPFEPPIAAFEPPVVEYASKPPSLIPLAPVPPLSPNPVPPVLVPNGEPPFIIPPPIILPPGGGGEPPFIIPPPIFLPPGGGGPVPPPIIVPGGGNPPSVTPVPEPSTLQMLVPGLAWIYAASRMRWRKRRSR